MPRPEDSQILQGRKDGSAFGAHAPAGGSATAEEGRVGGRRKEGRKGRVTVQQQPTQA